MIGSKSFKKIVCVVLCVCFLLPWSSYAKAEEYTPPTLSGSTYTVSTESQLRWVSAVCSGKIKAGTTNYPEKRDFSGYSVVLKNNISLGVVDRKSEEWALVSGEKWTPIGTEETPFAGVFNGNGFSVEGVFVSQNEIPTGFFGVLSGTVSNLTVKGYVSGKGDVGGISGQCFGAIEGCIFIGRVDGDGIVGGIVGKAKGTEESPCEIYLNVSVGEINAFSGECAGGIVGFAEHTTVSSCSGGADVYSMGNYTSGIVGLASAGVSALCCNSSGTITADGDTVVAGGILGASLEEVTLRNNSFEGMVYAAASTSAICGGIAGSFMGKIENSFVNGGVYSSIYFSETETDVETVCVSGGICGETAGGAVNNCYFSGISDCMGVEGYSICPDDSAVVENSFYSVGIAYVLYGTDEIYHVMALLTELKDWISSKTGYSSWQSVSGINESKPLLKHTNTAGSDGKNAWKVEGTVFTFYVDGNMDDYVCNQYGIVDTPWAVYRATIRTVKIKEGVTRVGNNAFLAFDNLRTLTLPSTLKEIGDYAFEQCVYLKNFTFPNGLEDIGEGAFRRCKAMTKVTLPKNIRAVRKNTFAYCEKLATVSIPSSVSLIGYMAFAMCDGLTTVTLPQSVREIDNYAFYYCDNLSKVVFPENLNRIGSYAFGRCEKLVDFDIPQNTRLEENVFWSVEQKGDIDGDGNYTVFDYLKIKSYLLGRTTLTKTEIKKADSDFNGTVTATDYLYVKTQMKNS